MASINTAKCYRNNPIQLPVGQSDGRHVGLPERNTRFRTSRIKTGSESERRRIKTYPETLPFSGSTQYSVNICECCRMPFGKHVTADQRSSYLTADADAQRKQDLRRQGIRKTVPSPRAADGKKEQLLPECDPAHQTGLIRSRPPEGWESLKKR